MTSTPFPPDANATSSPPRTPHDIAVELYRHLETALTKEYARRYEAGVVFQHAEERSANGVRLHIDLDYQDFHELSAVLVVHWLGGNRFEVRCHVENGGDRQFVFTPNQRADALRTRTQGRGQELATFLLHELERHLADATLSECDDPSPMAF